MILEEKREKEGTAEETLFWISKIVFVWPFGLTWFCAVIVTALPDTTTHICVHYQHFTLQALVSPQLRGWASALPEETPCDSCLQT